MAKNKYKLKKNNIEVTFQHISRYLQDKKWWNDEKKHLKAIKIYNKLKLEKLFNLSKKDTNKYSSTLLSALNDWCNRCINSKQWKKLSESITQAQVQSKLPKPKPKQEKTLRLSTQAYELLLLSAREKNTSISELIISLLAGKTETAAVKPQEKKPVQKIETIKYSNLNEAKPTSYKKIKKGNQYVIELWHYAGGQCQALSKATQKRCKRITPDLSIKQQTIDNTVYEFSVCSTHNKDTSQLDLSYY